MTGLPVWLPFALGAAVASAATPLVQERFRAPPFALGLVIQSCIALVLLPFVLASGLPGSPAFYAIAIGMSALWCINDVCYFNAVRTVGAGPVSRLLPGMTIVSFLLWFALDPALLLDYAATPWRSAGIALCVVASAVCAIRLRSCAVSRRAVQLLWFVMALNALAPLVRKLTLEVAQAPAEAPFALPFVEALAMLSFYGLFALARRDAPMAALRDPAARRTVWRAGLALGVVLAASNVCNNFGMLRTDHPAYVTVVVHAGVLLVILAHRLLGVRDESDVHAGLGIVAAAAALVVLKSL